jgi:hypothetical protein
LAAADVPGKDAANPSVAVARKAFQISRLPEQQVPESPVPKNSGVEA